MSGPNYFQTFDFDMLSVHLKPRDMNPWDYITMVEVGSIWFGEWRQPLSLVRLCHPLPRVSPQSSKMV